MAFYDPSRGDIVFRIVYDGLGTVGKTANLRALHGAFSGRSSGDIYCPAEGATGRTLYFDWMELRCGHIEDWPVRCEVLSVPGQFVFAERRFRLLHHTDAVVLVCESTPRGLAGGRLAWTFLTAVLESTGRADTPVLIQANKQDLPGALDVLDVQAEIARWRHGTRSPALQGPIFPASAVSGDGVRATFVSALQAARERFRESAADPLSLPGTTGPEGLFDGLRAAERGPSDPRLAMALDAALHAMASDPAA